MEDHTLFHCDGGYPCFYCPGGHYGNNQRFVLWIFFFMKSSKFIVLNEKNNKLIAGRLKKLKSGF